MKYKAYIILSKTYEGNIPNPPRLLDAWSTEEGPLLFYTAAVARQRFAELKQEHPALTKHWGIHEVHIELLDEIDDGSIQHTDTVA